MGLNTLERDRLDRELARMKERIAAVERMLQGQPVGTVRIEDAAITNAKIGSLAVDTANIQDAAITDAKIDSFTFTKGQGGTLKLGGLDNTNGVFSLVDADDDEKIYMDKDGIIIRDGRLLIENDAGDTTIDEFGVVSENNFVQTQSVYAALTQTISGTTEVDLTDSELNFSVDRPRAIMILFSASSYLNQSVGNTCNLIIRFRNSINGGSYNELARIIMGSEDGSFLTLSNFSVGLAVTPGTRSYKLTAQLEDYVGAPTALVYGYDFSYTILGT